jgi:hypothetical protein
MIKALLIVALTISQFSCQIPNLGISPNSTAPLTQLLSGLSANDLVTISNSMLLLTSITDQVVVCQSIQNPKTFDSCSKGINSTMAKCCYVKVGDKETCLAVPNEAQFQIIKIYSNAGFLVDCGRTD